MWTVVAEMWMCAVGIITKSRKQSTAGRFLECSTVHPSILFGRGNKLFVTYQIHGRIFNPKPLQCISPCIPFFSEIMLTAFTKAVL